MNEFKIKLSNNKRKVIIDVPENVLLCSIRQVWYPPIKNCNTCISIYTDDPTNKTALDLLKRCIDCIKNNNYNKISLIKQDKVVCNYRISYSAVRLLSYKYLGLYLYIQNEVQKK